MIQTISEVGGYAPTAASLSNCPHHSHFRSRVELSSWAAELHHEIQAAEKLQAAGQHEDTEFLGRETSPPQLCREHKSEMLQTDTELHGANRIHPFTVTTKRLLEANISKTWWMYYMWEVQTEGCTDGELEEFRSEHKSNVQSFKIPTTTI